MSRVIDLVNRLDNCPVGGKSWREFEDLCTENLEFLFKERGEDPCDLIVDLVERFYLQHE